MWDFADAHSDENAATGKQVDIWALEEVSLNLVDMLRSKMNSAMDKYSWVHNEKNTAETFIAISKKKFIAPTNLKKISLQRPLLFSARSGQETIVIANCHKPTKWQTPKEYKDIVEEIRAAWFDITRESAGTSTTICAGDFNIELWSDELDERAYAMKELLAAMGIN